MGEDRDVMEVLAAGLEKLAVAVNTTASIARIEATMQTLVKTLESCTACQKQIWTDSQRLTALEQQHEEQRKTNTSLWAQIEKLTWVPVGLLITICGSVAAGFLIFFLTRKP